MFQKPILLITFNRPQTTSRVLDAILSVNPSRLYVFSDGPRSGKQGEQALVDEVRNLFVDLPPTIDLRTNFQDSNMGCARGVTSAIDWVFATEAEAIILEDDCLPHPSFFTFCAGMLDRFLTNERVMHIAGTRWNPEFKIDSSYFFSSIGHVWGWATWKRAWQHYDFNAIYGHDVKLKIREALRTPLNIQYWKELFKSVSGSGPKLTWDYHWQQALFMRRGLAVVPDVNLITNIGTEGTHFGNVQNEFGAYAHLVAASTWQPQNHPAKVEQHLGFDLYHMNQHFLRHHSGFKRLKKLVKYYVLD